MSRAVLIAILGLVAAIAALILAATLDSSDDTAVSHAPPPVSTTAEPAIVANILPPPPSFDVIRIGADGNAVLAGRAAPKADVTVLDGDHELGQTTADDRGEWVLLPTLPLSAGARALTVRAQEADSDSETTRLSAPVILVVPERAGQPALAMAPDAEGGPRLILGPNADTGRLTVTIVDHDQNGRLFLAGHAPAEVTLFVYVDNHFAGQARSDTLGQWRLAVMDPSPAAHLLRADQVTATGKVLARAEVALQPPTAPTADGVTVEPGAARWTITRRLNGAGSAYTVIYEAGRDQARDPGKTYPGQVSQPPRD